MDSTKDYVTNARASREAYARELLTKTDSADDETREAADDELAEWPLSVEAVRHVEILLSWGGPADWLDVTLYDDGAVRAVTHHAVWGTDRAESDVREGDALWSIAERFVEVVSES